MSTKFSAKDILEATHNERAITRSVVGAWINSLDAGERSRFGEYIDAYLALPAVGLPDLVHAIRDDEDLGPTYPKISNESLAKWIRTVHGKEKES